MRPAKINVDANVTIAIVNTHEVCARFQPNSFSSGSTNTLQAYNDPSARFIDIPPMTTRQRFIICAFSKAAIISKTSESETELDHGPDTSWTVFSAPEPYRSGTKKVGSVARTHRPGMKQYRNLVKSYISSVKPAVGGLK